MHPRISFAVIAATVCLWLILAAALSASPHPSYTHRLPVDTVPFYPDGTYDESVPRPNDYLTHPVGEWPNRFDEVIGYLKVLAEQSDRVVMEKHGTTHEGRSQYNLFIGLPENIERLEEIKAASASLAFDRFASDSELQPNRPMIEQSVQFHNLLYPIHIDRSHKLSRVSICSV